MNLTKKDLIECYDVGWETERVKRIKPSILNRDSGVLKILNVISLMDLDKSKNILDLGCGIGQLAFLLQDKYPKNKIIGIDLSKKQINLAKDLAKKYNLKNTQFLTGDIENLNEKKLRKFSPDYITLIEVLEHVTNPKKVFNSLKKICNKNTKIIITVPIPCHNKNGNSYWYLQRINNKEIATQDKNKINLNEKYYKLYHKEYQQKEILSLLRKNNFVIESYKGIIFRPIKTKNPLLSTLMNRSLISLNLDRVLNYITNDKFSRSTIIKARLR